MLFNTKVQAKRKSIEWSQVRNDLGANQYQLQVCHWLASIIFSVLDNPGGRKGSIGRLLRVLDEMTWHKVFRPCLWTGRMVIIIKVNGPQDIRRFHIEDSWTRCNIVHPGSGLLLLRRVQ